jgi:hypothetical protein
MRSPAFSNTTTSVRSTPQGVSSRSDAIARMHELGLLARG